jgi:hypothetical protein
MQTTFMIVTNINNLKTKSGKKFRKNFWINIKCSLRGKIDLASPGTGFQKGEKCIYFTDYTLLVRM